MQAEQYVITTQFDTYQPATLKATLNGKAIALHHNADGSLDVTPFVKKGKNTLQLECTPGQNGTTYAKSTLTLGPGTQGQWKTLYNRVLNQKSVAGKANFVLVRKLTHA